MSVSEHVGFVAQVALLHLRQTRKDFPIKHAKPLFGEGKPGGQRNDLFRFAGVDLIEDPPGALRYEAPDGRLAPHQRKVGMFGGLKALPIKPFPGRMLASQLALDEGCPVDIFEAVLI